MGHPPLLDAGATPTPRVALVHDWLTGMRGGEKVLEVLCELYPSAELFTLLHVPGSVSPSIERSRPRRSVLQGLPFVRRYYRQYLPLFPFVIEQFDLDRFDLLISTSHCAAKAVVRTGRARHLCYCHTPMRYAWDQYEDYFPADRLGPLRRALARPVMSALARWDAATAHRVDRFVANSQHVADRIRRYYDRRAAVVHPPVDTDFFHPDGTAAGSPCLVVSALVPYKRIDLAIDACRLIGAPLRIVGTGPEFVRLRRMAGPAVEFLGARSDAELRDLYRQAATVVLPGEEEFGIALVEAQACGRPVVALDRGGARETVRDGATGALVGTQTAAAFADAIERVRQTRFDPAEVRASVLRFSRRRFADEIAQCVHDLVDAPQGQTRW